MSLSSSLETRPYGQILPSERLHLLAFSVASGMNLVQNFPLFTPQ